MDVAEEDSATRRGGSIGLAAAVAGGGGTAINGRRQDSGVSTSEERRGRLYIYAGRWLGMLQGGSCESWQGSVAVTRCIGVNEGRRWRAWAWACVGDCRQTNRTARRRVDAQLPLGSIDVAESSGTREKAKPQPNIAG